MTDMQTAQTGAPLDTGFLLNILNQVQELDAKLDRSSGSQTVHRNAIENELSAKYADQFGDKISEIVDRAQGLDEEQRAAFVLLVQDSLEEAYSGEIDTMLDARAKKRAEEQVPLDEAEEKSIREARGKLNDQYKAARQLLEAWGQDVSNVPKPKMRRGPRPGTTRGPRQISRFQFRVGDMLINKRGLNPIAQAIFGMPVKDFKALVKNASEGKIDLSDAENLPDEWEVTLTKPDTGDEVILHATRDKEYRESDEDGSDEDESEVQPDEVETE